MGVQKDTTKNVLQKNRAEKFLQKKSTKNPKPIFSRFCFLRFWAFLGEGSSKTQQKSFWGKSMPKTFGRKS
jgi:hypothetical protein